MNRKAIIYAILAAVFCGTSSLFSKLLLNKLSPTFMAVLLYLGAGIGMSIINLFQKNNKKVIEKSKFKKRLSLFNRHGCIRYFSFYLFDVSVKFMICYSFIIK